MKPTKVKIQAFVKPYLRSDERGEYLVFDEAEMMLDKLLDEYIGIMTRYLTTPTGREELVITSAAGRTEFGRFRVKR